MSKILEIETLNEWNGWVNYEVYETFNDDELKELLSSYKDDEINEAETLTLDELIKTFNEGYPTLKIYEGNDKLEYFKDKIKFLQCYDNSDTYYHLFNDIGEFKEFRSQVLNDYFYQNNGFVYNEVDFWIDELKNEKELYERVEIEGGNGMFLYYEKSGMSDYELMNNVLRIDEDLYLKEFNSFIKSSK